MSCTWADVERIGLSLPESSLGEAHEGSPAVFVRSKQFARLRITDDDREVLQFWVAEPDLVQAYVDDDPTTYGSARGYSPCVVMATLARLGIDLLRELLVESWSCRAPARLRAAHADLR